MNLFLKHVWKETQYSYLDFISFWFFLSGSLQKIPSVLYNIDDVAVSSGELVIRIKSMLYTVMKIQQAMIST